MYTCECVCVHITELYYSWYDENGGCFGTGRHYQIIDPRKQTLIKLKGRRKMRTRERKAKPRKKESRINEASQVQKRGPKWARAASLTHTHRFTVHLRPFPTFFPQPVSLFGKMYANKWMRGWPLSHSHRRLHHHIIPFPLLETRVAAVTKDKKSFLLSFIHALCVGRRWKWGRTSHGSKRD